MSFISLAEAALRIERSLDAAIVDNNSRSTLTHPVVRKFADHIGVPHQLMSIGYEDGSGTSFLFEVIGETGRRHVYLRHNEFQPTAAH